MDIERRRTLAAAVAALLPEVEAAVVASWVALLPASRTWTADEAARAERAVRAALHAYTGVIVQGDLDDQAWQRLKAEVTAHGRMSPEEVAEVLRTIRVVGVEVLADRLTDTIGLPPDERWSLQSQAGWLFEQLAEAAEEVDERRVTDLLAELHRRGPDVA